MISDTAETCGVDYSKPPVVNEIRAQFGLFFVIMILLRNLFSTFSSFTKQSAYVYIGLIAFFIKNNSRPTHDFWNAFVAKYPLF